MSNFRFVKLVTLTLLTFSGTFSFASEGGANGGGTNRPPSDRSVLELQAIANSNELLGKLDFNGQVARITLLGRNQKGATYQVETEFINHEKQCVFQIVVDSRHELSIDQVKVISATDCQTHKE